MSVTQDYKKPSRKALETIVGALADRIERLAALREGLEGEDHQYWGDVIAEVESAAAEIGETELLKRMLQNGVEK